MRFFVDVANDFIEKYQTNAATANFKQQKQSWMGRIDHLACFYSITPANTQKMGGHGKDVAAAVDSPLFHSRMDLPFFLLVQQQATMMSQTS